MSLPHTRYAMPAQARGCLAIIGEAPGAEEARQGIPFVGRSGQLLDKNLALAGINRADCLIANVFRLQPPGNKVAHFFASARQAAKEGIALAKIWGKTSHGYCRAEFAAEIAFLQQTLHALRPAVILSLGATPFWALTGQTGITTARGQFFPCRLLPHPTPVLPTFHPSYILRGNWPLEPLFLADIRAAKRVAAGDAPSL